MSDLTMQLPDIALSVRQPWAWAIIHGGKDIENRSAFAVTKGAMVARHICIHAAKGMTWDEYGYAQDFMEDLGVDCPGPDALIRGGVIGCVTVTAIIKKSDSPWFFGPRGLVLTDAQAIEPIPTVGQLGYFKWKQSDELTDPLPWMVAWPDDVRHKTVKTRTAARAVVCLTRMQRV